MVEKDYIFQKSNGTTFDEKVVTAVGGKALGFDSNGDPVMVDGPSLFYSTEYDNGSKSTDFTLDWNNGLRQKVTTTGNAVLTFTAPTQGICNLQLRILGDGTTRTITWPSTVKWANATAPTLTNTAGRWDIISLYYDGTNYSAIHTPNFG